MNIIELAKQAGLSVQSPQWGYSESHHFAGFEDKFERFAALVRAAALDEAAGVCDREAKRAYQNDGLDDGYESGKSVAAKNCVNAIRQLKETK